ncbi:hypothetical protein ebA4474 [Aromatoleum aromaticum EbN1]|uniref:Uncharacterized protein n=1 Tax=Aromatoleum aromaticum (strain DSM 19018 / LMG 30748 / EbN1) TaxID=76114 RepID=Q5P205_AROAE|nr:hypothetical protein ebA4474 [Aromatoleum aromaticum EbN1]
MPADHFRSIAVVLQRRRRVRRSIGRFSLCSNRSYIRYKKLFRLCFSGA